MNPSTRIEGWRGDITRLAVDAIVNAANESLLGGGGVDAAIPRAAGPQLLAYCRGLGGCPTGEARLTPGFSLPARNVIHTVGPVWQGGQLGEPEQLANCYRACLRLAGQSGLATLAFPAISCGAYGYPIAAATAIAVREVRTALASGHTVQRVTFVSFCDEVYAAYRAELGPAA